MVSRKDERLTVCQARGAVTMLAVAILMAGASRAQDIPAKPQEYVIDLAGVVDAATETRLNGYLQELERKTGAQMLVLTVKTTGGVPIREFALRTAEKWKLGKAKKDNGVLIVVAVDDHKWDIDAGYGLESVLPDALCGRVGREVFVPSFRKNQYSQGIAQGTVILANQVATAAGAKIVDMPVQRLASRGPGGRELGGCSCAGVGLVMLMLLLSGLGRRRYGYRRWGGYHTGGLLTGLLLGQMLGGRHGGWGGSMGGGSWGGGFGGFGGGSFGGGGGGSFGGGGASGGW
jgi:uncharacterized protein